MSVSVSMLVIFAPNFPKKKAIKDLNKSLSISLMERKENCRKFNIQKKNKKANAIRQRGGNVVNVN